MSELADLEKNQALRINGLVGQLTPELRTLVDVVQSSPFPMFILVGAERVLIYNEAYAPILGHHHPSALGRPFFDVWPEVRDTVGHVIDKAFGGQSTRFDNLPVTLNRPDPEEAWFTFSYSPVRDETSTIVSVLCICTETTQAVLAKHRQEFLLNLESNFRGFDDPLSIVRAAQASLGQYFGVSRVGYGNLDPEQRYFTTEENWTDGSVPSHSGTHDLAAFGEEIFSALREGVTLAINDTLQDPRAQDASATAAFAALQVRSVATVSLIKGGRFVAALYLHHHQPRRWTKEDVGLIEDVAERTWSAVEHARAEAELRQLNETLEAQVAERSAERDRLWNLSQDLLARADYTGMMSAVSPAWTTILGWSEAELLSRGYASFMHPDDMPPTLQTISHMAETRRPTRFENRIAAADGTYKPIEWTVAPEPDSQNFIAVGRDMSVVKAREEELEHAQEALRQSQKMEAVGQLTGGLAHDFNNILAGIGGSLQLMSTRLAQGRIAELDRYITAASGAAQRAASLTQRLLAFSRRQTLEPKPVDLNGLVNGMLELVNRSVGPAIEVEAVSASGLWTTSVDAGQLENALLNLCINARDAMPDGGKLTIETGNRWMDDRRARQHNMAAGQYVSLCVSDTGIGMTPDVVERAFDPFFTTKPLGQGTGLGLSMVYGFAGQSGGAVRIYSEVGKGTMVCIYLPRHLGDLAVQTAEETAQQPPRADQGQTVLLVDDEPLVRMIAAEALVELGYTIIEAGDGASALKILNSPQPIDLLITDVGLPGGTNGRQVADAARVSRPELRVLFITGYAENAVLNHGHLDPGMQVLTKPFQIEALARRVRELIAD